jgi:hypothetical protein
MGIPAQGKLGASEMNEMINSKTDQKNIGLLKNLWQLRQALDVYCLRAPNVMHLSGSDDR